MTDDGFGEDEVVGRAVDARLLRRLGTFLRPHLAWFAWSTLALAIVSVLDLLPTHLVKVALDGSRVDSQAGRH